MTDQVSRADFLIYAGPGALARPANEDLLNASRIVFFEPDSDRRAQLEARYQADANVEVRGEALGQSDGNRRLGRYNDADMNSMCAPTELLTFMPGLRQLGYSDAIVRSVAGYVADHVPKGVRTRLVLDVNGAERAILSGLAENSLFGMFSEIHVFCGATALFDGAFTRAEVAELLKNKGFKVEAETASGAVFSRVCAVSPTAGRNMVGLGAPVDVQERNRLKREAEAMRARAETAEQAAADAKNRADQASAEFADHKKKTATLKATIARMKKQAEEAQGALTEAEERAAASSAEAEAAKAELETARKELEAARAELSTVKSESEERATTASAELEAARKELEVVKAELSGLKAEAAAERERYEGKLADLEKQLDAATQTGRELEGRNARLDGEFIRAEAQIDLIKDLLFNDRTE